jgi:hypothetical protein
VINNAWPWCVPDFNVFFNEAKVALAAKGITALDGTTLHGLRGTACIRLKREGFADSVIADMVGMSIAMVQRYTRFEDKRATGKSVLALLAARKIGTANDPATPNCKTLENVKRYPLKTLRKIWHCRMSAFRPRREK